MKQSDGFTRPWPSVITISAMVGSVGLIALAMRAIPLSTAYPIRTGIGAVAPSSSA
jgi:quaternary ammonium compound-resistance protein SugE